MSRRVWYLITSISCVMLFMLGCNPNPQPPGLTPIPTLAPAETVTLVPALLRPPRATGVLAPSGEGDAALGAALYLESCSPCHGAEGEGVDAPPLRNSEYVQTKGDQAILTTTAEGLAGTEMPAWLVANGGPLTNADVSHVVAYLHTLQDVPPLPTATPQPEEPAPTPLPPGAPTPEPAQPSEPGGPGAAATMSGDSTRGQPEFGLYCARCHGPEGVQGIPNPGSDDGSVPVLNPIDPTLVSSDLNVFAVNVDLFIEHGSLPEGPGPLIVMPSFGDSRMLSDQQIADLIAYVIYLNSLGEAE